MDIVLVELGIVWYLEYLFPGPCGCRVGCSKDCVDVQSTCLTQDCDVGVLVGQRTVYMYPGM